MGIESKKNFIINTVYIVLWAVIVFLSLRWLFKYLFPFLLAVGVAALLQPFCERLAKKTRLKFSFWAVICVIVFYLCALALLSGVVFIMIKFAGSFYSEIPEILSDTVSALERAYKTFENGISKLPDGIYNFINGSVGSLKGFLSESLGVKISSAAGALAQKTPSFLVSFIITLVSSFYITKDYKKLVKFIKEILPERIFLNTVKIKSILFENVFKIGLAYLILTLITFAQLFILFLITGIDRALLLAAIISFVDLLPVLGAGVILIPWGVISLIIGNTALGIKLVLIYVFLTVTRNFIEPKIVSKQMGVGPLLTLIAMFLGLKIMGVAGVLLFPIALTVLFKYYKQE